jgi:hypothetical protein
VISGGDGKVIPLWESRWFNGTSPKELAPNLYQITKFKHRCVHDELKNLNWIKSLGDIHSFTAGRVHFDVYVPVLGGAN